jgi:hypothetical protein
MKRRSLFTASCAFFGWLCGVKPQPALPKPPVMMCKSIENCTDEELLAEIRRHQEINRKRGWQHPLTMWAIKMCREQLERKDRVITGYSEFTYTGPSLYR